MHRLIFLTALTMFAALTFTTTVVFAAEAPSTLSWTPPTTYVDGSPLSVEEIQEYRIYYAVDEAVVKTTEYITANDFQKRAVITLTLTPRVAPYVVNFAMSTVATNGMESALSETVSKKFNLNTTAEPSAPTAITVTISCNDGCTITIQPITE